MADTRKTYLLREEEVGTVRIAEDLVPVIAAFAATEVDGVTALAGNVTHDIVRKVSSRALSQGIRMEVKEREVRFEIVIHVDFTRSLMEISREVQERVINNVETMTGLTVTDVNVRVADINEKN